MEKIHYIIHVEYNNGKFDYINTLLLDKYLEKNNIKRFFRPSEEKWIDVIKDPIRKVKKQTKYNRRNGD